MWKKVLELMNLNSNAIEYSYYIKYYCIFLKIKEKLLYFSVLAGIRKWNLKDF